MTLLDLAWWAASALMLLAAWAFCALMADEARETRRTRERNIQRQITRGQR